MSVILILILASLAMWRWRFWPGFIWAVRSGQFEDTCTPAMRILGEDESQQTGARTPRRAVRGRTDASERRR